MTTTEEAPEKGRFLSQLDFEVQRGTLPSSDGGKVLPLDVVYVHIPKTAGDSVMTASSKHLLKGQHLQGNREAAYLEHDTQARLKSKQHRSLAFVMLRNPLTHVLSQFLECKYDGWGQYVTEGLGFPGYGKLDNALDGFDEWIAHFALRPNKIDVVKKNKRTKDAFNCYNPWNLQTRYLSTGSDWRSTHFRKSKEDQTTLEKAKAHLHDQQLIVGITEHFSASMCLLEHAATKGKLVSEACLSICDGSPPPHNRALATAADAPHKSHHVPPHSLKMVTNQTTLEHLQTLTQLDQELYNAAASLFQENIDRIHQETGVDLLCREKKTTTKKKGGKQKNKKKTNAKNPAAKDKKKAPIVVEDAAASKEQPPHEEELLKREANTHGVGGSVGAEETEEETWTQQGASVTTSVMANATDVMPPLLTSGIVLTSNATEFSTPELPPSSVSGSTDSNDSILLFQLTSVLAVVGYVLVFLGLRKRGWFRFSPSAQEYSLVETNTEKEDV